jgi:hypothetical protein
VSALAGLLLAAAAGCHTVHLTPLNLDKPEKEQPLAAPAKYSFRLPPYAFLADFELNPNLPLFQELANLRDQVHKELQLPPSNTVVQVFLFQDRERYERFMQTKYPELPKRRAFFVAQPHSIGGAEDLLVYTFWGERIQQDLRHELTHALLHSVLKDVPLWLDEGLAEFFETPPGWEGVNYTHLDLLRRDRQGQARPDLARLEQLSQVQQMTPAEYREAWAWVHLMLRDKPEAKKVLIAYLQQLRTNPTPGPLRPRLAAALPDLEDSLDKHLAQLDNRKARAVSDQR